MLSWGKFSVGFKHMVLIFFRKYITFAIDWNIIWLYLENLIFPTVGSSWGHFWPEGDFLLILSIWFLYFSESIYNFQLIDILCDYIWELWFFTLWGAAIGDIFCSRGTMHSCALIVSITFFNCLGVRNIWAKFHAFITICTILTISCASGLDYKTQFIDIN